MTGINIPEDLYVLLNRVAWERSRHTQGSGKSYSMVFFSLKVLRKIACTRWWMGPDPGVRPYAVTGSGPGFGRLRARSQSSAAAMRVRKTG